MSTYSFQDIWSKSLIQYCLFFFFKNFFFKKIMIKKDFFTVFYIFHENDIKNFLNDQMFKIFSNDLLTNITRVRLT